MRDLLDSLFVGFPVGTLVLWHTSNEKDARALGAERPGPQATTLVIDGQQRLTSLFAIMQGVEVVGKEARCEGSRSPFGLATEDSRSRCGHTKEPESLPRTELWNGTSLKPQIRRDLIDALRDKGRTIDEDTRTQRSETSIEPMRSADFRFPTVDIRKTASTKEEETNEEDVAEIFVRINNQGTRLGQADFVLTLMSVFHGELRDRIEERSRAMSNGTVVAIDTQQLLRAVCGVAFGRAPMSAVYRYLRGVDPTTGEADPAGRIKRLHQLDEAAKACMEATPWRDFLLRVKHAGFVSQGLIASRNAIVNAYAFYIPANRQKSPRTSSTRSLPAGSSELAYGTLFWVIRDHIRAGLGASCSVGPDDADGFVRALDEAMSETITGDYWTQSLVSALETQKAGLQRPSPFERLRCTRNPRPFL